MLSKETEQRQAIELLCTDMLVPTEHLLRKIDAAVDFTHRYSIPQHSCCCQEWQLYRQGTVCRSTIHLGQGEEKSRRIARNRL